MNWLRNAVIDGLQTLLVLRLDGSPANDTVQAVANVWINVFTRQPIAWDEELDTPRLREAFLRGASYLKAWPSPRGILDYLPPRPQRLSLNHHGMYSPMPAAIKEQLKAALNDPINQIKRGDTKANHTIELYQLPNDDIGFRIRHNRPLKTDAEMSAVDILITQLSETLALIGTNLNKGHRHNAN